MGCKKLLSIALAILFCAELLAQQTLSGKIRDGADLPLEFAVIRLLRDSVEIKATLSDTTGHFIFQNVPSGNYSLSALALGFAPVRLLVNLQGDTTIEIRLTDKARDLNEVVIQSSTGTLQRKADRFIYTVANKESSKGASALEALQQTPLMQVDETKNVIKLLNKPNTVVYINGRRSYLTAEALMNLLKNSPAENIIRIEMITTPGSEYQAEGNAGIINIVMKKNRSDHFNGNFRVSDSYATYNTPGTGLNLNARKDKLAAAFGIYVNNNQSQDRFTDSFHFLIDDRKQKVKSFRDRSVLFTGGSLTLDYDLTSRQTIGCRGDFNISNEWKDNFSSENRYFSFSQEVPDSIQRTIQAGSSTGQDYSFNTNYQLQLDTLGSTLNMDLDYSSYSELKSMLTHIDLYDGNDLFLTARQRYKQEVPQEFRNWSSRTELSTKWGKRSNLKLGLQSSITNTDNDSYFGNKKGNDYEMDTQRSYHYQYSEQIYSAFVSLERSWSESWQSSTGLRAENSYNRGEEIRTADSFNNEYLHILPYVSMSYARSTQHQFSWTFSNRVRRPAFWELNPFRYYLASNIYIENNPFLRPERSYIGEFTYVLKEKYTFLLGYTHAKDAYSQFTLTDTPNVIKYVRLNYGTSEDLSCTFTTQQDLFKGFWQTNLTVTGSLIRYDGSAEYVQFKKQSFSFVATCNNTIHLSKHRKWLFLANLSYKTPTAWYYGKENSTHELMLGIRKRWNQCVLSLRCYDILKGQNIIYQEEDGRTFREGKLDEDSRFVLLAFSYNFGNRDIKGSRNRETSNTEWKNRTQK